MNIQIYILPSSFFYYKNPRLQVKEMVNREYKMNIKYVHILSYTILAIEGKVVDIALCMNT